MTMDCLIIDELPLIQVGLVTLINHHFPHWRCSTADHLHAAIRLVASAATRQGRLIVLGLGPRTSAEPDLLGDFLQAAGQREDRVLILGGEADTSTRVLCEQAGASGFVTKSENVSTLVHALEVVGTGGRYFSAAERLRTLAPPRDTPRFTERQKDILDLLLAGFSNKRIADSLKLTPGTVKNYIFDLMRLLNVGSRLELAMRVKELGYQSRHSRGDTGSSGFQADPAAPSAHFMMS